MNLDHLSLTSYEKGIFGEAILEGLGKPYPRVGRGNNFPDRCWQDADFEIKDLKISHSMPPAEIWNSVIIKRWQKKIRFLIISILNTSKQGWKLLADYGLIVIEIGFQWLNMEDLQKATKIALAKIKEYMRPLTLKEKIGKVWNHVKGFKFTTTTSKNERVEVSLAYTSSTLDCNKRGNEKQKRFLDSFHPFCYSFLYEVKLLENNILNIGGSLGETDTSVSNYQRESETQPHRVNVYGIVAEVGKVFGGFLTSLLPLTQNMKSRAKKLFYRWRYGNPEKLETIEKEEFKELKNYLFSSEYEVKEDAMRKRLVKSRVGEEILHLFKYEKLAEAHKLKKLLGEGKFSIPKGSDD